MEKINLFCLPFAGASRYSYHFYAKECPDMLNIVSVEIPGRGARFRETLLTSMNEIVEDVFAQVTPRLNAPYAIYGHSMGALMGYLLTRKILEAQLRPPLHLFVTGCAAPSAKSTEPIRHLLPKEAFLDELREMGGSPEEILANKELLDFFEPVLRADFQAIERYAYEETEPFAMPITCINGSDERIPVEHAEAWRKETKGAFRFYQLPGHHFFINKHYQEVLRMIVKKLYPLTVEKPSSNLNYQS